MHHKKTTSPPKGSIKGVRITSIKGKILVRPWVHLIWGNVIKSFRRLVIALGNLRPEFSRKFADRICFEWRKLAGPILLPDLQRAFFLIDADQNRCRTVHVEAFHVTQRRHSHGASSRYWRHPVMCARTTTENETCD